MRKIEQNEIQPILLNILKCFKEYCGKWDIDFMLAGGTLLGAIRHNGFIPWDDDIDIYVTRPNYDRLIKAAEEEPYLDEEKRYRILPPASGLSVYPFINIVDTKTIAYENNIKKKFAKGLWIDVFLLGYLPDDKKTMDRRLRKFGFYKAMNKIIIGGNYKTIKYRLLEPLAFPVRSICLLLGKDSRYWCRKIVKMNEDEPESHHLGNAAWPLDRRDYFRAEWFEETIDAEFENDTYKIPAGYDAILTHFYGDYMVLPPEDKRVRHDPEAYWIE